MHNYILQYSTIWYLFGFALVLHPGCVCLVNKYQYQLYVHKLYTHAQYSYTVYRYTLTKGKLDEFSVKTFDEIRKLR